MSHAARQPQHIHLSSHVIFLSNVAGPYNAEAPDPLVGPFVLDPHSHSERSPALPVRVNETNTMVSETESLLYL